MTAANSPSPEFRCPEQDCPGPIDDDGYCEICGTKGVAAAELVFLGALPEEPSDAGTTMSGRSASSSGRLRLGEGLARVPPEPGYDDPEGAVLTDPTLPERKRFCPRCVDTPVGRSRDGRPGLLRGYCPKCRHPFDFEPKLCTGEIVGSQYEVVGCLAHGGLGWVYLARDTAVSKRLVVLKGLLNAGDLTAREVAQAERDALAQMHHPNIVEIYNFVQHQGAEYIVMEYVNGLSLKQKLDQRRRANGGRLDPFPVDQAIDYILAVLPAFSYLHERNLVYCDFKLDNVIQVGYRVKLIDLGAVRRFDDTSGDSFGTSGYQAPEVEQGGAVSVASDLYTIGRSLAVLTLEFPHRSLRFSLPEPAGHPALRTYDSFHRFLLKATAEKPSSRFQSAAEMRDQLLGVLNEVVARSTGQPQPSPPAAFAIPADDEALPPLAIDPTDSGATFLANLSADDPRAVLEEIDAAVASGRATESVELQLRRIRAHIEAGDLEASNAMLRDAAARGPATWRLAWLRGLADLGRTPAEAVKAFEVCMSEVPGELAPKLGAALALEASRELDRAASLFAVVTTVDPSYVAAAKGLARCLAQQGEIHKAVQALDRIPRTHRAYVPAQADAIKMLIGDRRYGEARERLDRLDVDKYRFTELQVELLEATLSALTSGEASSSTPNSRQGTAPLQERPLRESLEGALRRLAQFTSDPDERCRMVDRANRIRPVTLL
ncbi:MAG: tetratricopeptide repeat protein [Acidimicrobiales bacterium]